MCFFSEMADVGSDLVIVVILLLLNICYNFSGICVKLQIVILLNYSLFTSIFSRGKVTELIITLLCTTKICYYSTLNINVMHIGHHVLWLCQVITFL